MGRVIWQNVTIPVETRFALLALACLAGTSSCGPSLPAIDEKPFLAEIGFEQPITVTVHIGPENLGSEENANMVAFLVKAAALRVTPNPSAAPWWSFDHVGEFSQTVARRIVIGRSNQRDWSEGSINYHAETISYRLDIVPPFALPAVPNGQSFTLRLALKFDPAIGQWRLAERGTQFDPRDAVNILTQMMNVGAMSRAELITAIAQAKIAAYDQIEQRLKDDGVLERVHPAVLVSRANGRAYYIGVAPVRATTMQEALDACTRISEAGYGPWRLIAFGELTVFSQDQFGSRFIDVPDGRLWGTTGQPIPNSDAWFLTRTISARSNARADPANPEFDAGNLPEMNYSASVKGMELDRGGHVRTLYFPIYYGFTDQPRSVAFATSMTARAEFRMICVTNLQ